MGAIGLQAQQMTDAGIAACQWGLSGLPCRTNRHPVWLSVTQRVLMMVLAGSPGTIPSDPLDWNTHQIAGLLRQLERKYHKIKQCGT